MVLPMMNRSAKNPADMYSFDQFIKEDDLDVLFTEATTFLSEYNTVQKMSEQGKANFKYTLLIMSIEIYNILFWVKNCYFRCFSICFSTYNPKPDQREENVCFGNEIGYLDYNLQEDC